MRPRQEPSELVTTLAVHQAGVVTTAQVRSAGMSRHVLARLVREGRWTTLAPGIHLTAAEVSWDALAWGGHLAGGPNSRLGAEASAFLSGLVTQAPAPLDLLVPAQSMVRSHGPWVFRRERPGARSPRRVGSPPRLTVEDTVLDLAEQGDEAALVGWVTTAVQRRLTTVARLRRSLADRSRSRHRAVLEALLSDVADGAESPLEVRFLRDVERAHGLPPGRRQRSRSGLPYCTDVTYDQFPLIVELDGRAGHEGVGRFRDMDRDNLHLLDGRGTLRYGWFAVLDHPCAVAAQLAAALRMCGWSGVPSRCSRCAAVPEGSWQLMP